MAPAKDLAHNEIDSRPDLPDIFPQGEVTVRGEQQIYEEFETGSGTEERLVYPLSKGPINTIEGIRGTDKTGSTSSFASGVDFVVTELMKERDESFTFFTDKERYELVDPPDNPSDLTIIDGSGDTYQAQNEFQVINPDDVARDTIEWFDDQPNPDNGESFRTSYDVTYPDSAIEWQTDGDKLPKVGTKFYTTYRAPSVISRYLDASEERLDNVEDAIQGVIEAKYIDTASGQELDEIGNLFGSLIGKRRGRTDDQYRVFLRSAIQSFTSRGTVNGIKLAVSAATDVPLEDITIDEDFEDNSYQVIVVAATPVTGSLLEEIAEVADPSGVNQERTRFTIPADEIQVDDSVETPEGGEASDTTGIDDAVTQKRTTASDTTGIDDATTSTIGDVAFWDQDNWNDGSTWTAENN